MPGKYRIAAAPLFRSSRTAFTIEFKFSVFNLSLVARTFRCRLPRIEENREI